MTCVRKCRIRCRRGAALIMAIVCLVIVTSLAVEIMRSMVAARQQSRFQRNELQATWLAEAGVSRAEARLNQAPTYHGETWTPELDLSDLSPHRVAPNGSVEIKIEPVAESETRRRVIVTATFPADSPATMRCRRERVVQLAEGEKS